jgi:hypothetical protein
MRHSRFFILGTVGIVTALAGACGSDAPAEPGPTSAPTVAPTTTPATTTSTTPAAPATSATTGRGATATPTTTKGPSGGGAAVKSDLSQLKAVGIDVEVPVILDVADDGVDRFLQIGKNGVVDFTGTTRTDSTMMSLKPAAVRAKNRVTIKPPFWNEGPGAGSCVADTSGAALKLETCKPGKAAQIWQLVPAGDSGQFELRGAYGILHVEGGKLVTGDTGRTGLQTLDFAG